MAGKRWLIAVVLLALGPVLAAAYAVVNLVAIRTAVKAQITGPEWGGGRLAADGMTALGRDYWSLVLIVAVVVGVLGVMYAVMGALLRRGGRGRTPLLVVSGVLIVPYALAVLFMLTVPAKAAAGLYDSPDFADGIPAWQPATVLVLVAAGLAQAVGMVLAAVEGRRAAAARS
ncbi:hypothetical protein ACIBQ1_00690 [Nonomuraea sp. NPDC050153]|uniref:hypothetical protein n=1 Tax=Nonomuraea sp. NPDC050153 TaxID=3364359 RepID=UPI0037B80627